MNNAYVATYLAKALLAEKKEYIKKRNIERLMEMRGSKK